MKTSLDCIPCFVRQALSAARMVSADPAVHERIVRELLLWVGEMTFEEPPPVLAQRIHRRLREILGMEDPYRDAKDQQNRMAISLLPELRSEIEATLDPLPLTMAVRTFWCVPTPATRVEAEDHDSKRHPSPSTTLPLCRMGSPLWI